MKKILKKIICLILLIGVLITNIPVYALDNGLLDYAEAMDEMDNILDEMDVPSLDDQINDFIIESEKYFGKTSEQLENITKSLNSVSYAMTAFQYVSYATSAVSNIMNILKMIGVMEDPNESKLNSILDAVKSIKADVEEINKKVSLVQKNLESNFADLSYEQTQNKAQSYHNVWANFIKNEYSDMMKIFTAYEERVNQTAIKWVGTWKNTDKTDLRALYNNKGLLLYSGSNFEGYEASLPDVPDSSDDTYSKKLDTNVSYNIVLPAKYLSISSKTSINADNYEEIIRNTVKNGVISAIDDGVIKIDADSLPFWNIDEKTTNEVIISQITEDLVNSMLYEITSMIANSTVDNGSTFAQNALFTYQQFCGALTAENYTDSAIGKALESLTLTYAFYGETKESAMSYYSLVGMSTMQFGTLTSILVAATPSIKSSAKNDLAKLIYKTMETNNIVYKNFQRSNDNYCYPLKGVLSYVDVNAQTVSTSDTKYEYEGCTGGRCEWSDKHERYVDWKIVDSSIDFNTDNLDVYEYNAKKNEANLKKSMVNTQDLEYLYHYIQALSTGKNIIDYLKDNKVITGDGKHSTTLVTPNFSIKDQPLDNTQLKSYPFASDFKVVDKYNDDTIRSGYNKDNTVTAIKDKDYKTLVHTKIVGDTFSISGMTSDATAKGEAESRLTSDVTLGTRVFQYYDKAFATPRYILHDKATVTVDVSEAATDTQAFYLAQPYRSIYTATVSKNYGALVVNYDVDADATSYQTIDDKEEFLEFIKDIASGATYEGKNIILNKDIDLSGVDFEDYWPNSLNSKEFKGHFNGNGKTINNLTIKSGGRVGLFRTTGENAVIENLKLDNVNIVGTENSKGYAVLVGYANGKLIVDNVEILNGSVTGYKYVAGIVGESKETSIVNVLNSKNNADITSNDTDAGGIIANTGSYYIYNCMNSGDITAKRGAAGGISGYSGNDKKNDTSFVRNSINTGTIIGYDCAGGISGHIQSDNRFSRFFGNTNSGPVTVTYKGSAGGIVGYTEAGGSYINNKNTGAIESKDRYAGGIIGENEDDPILIQNNTNEGSVIGVNKTGGIAGYLGDKDYDSITVIISNTNSGIIESTSKDTGDAGGIIGSIYTDNKKHSIKDNKNTGKVTAARQAGGIVGYMAGGGVFDSNENKATILSKTQNAGGIVGKIQDDKCEFKNSNIYKPRIIIGDNLSVTNETFDYQIRVNSNSMHAGKICGWDDYKDATINADSLVATIFGEGNILIISAITLLLAIGGIVTAKVYNKNTKSKSKK